MLNLSPFLCSHSELIVHTIMGLLKVMLHFRKHFCDCATSVASEDTSEGLSLSAPVDQDKMAETFLFNSLKSMYVRMRPFSFLSASSEKTCLLCERAF